MTHPAQRCPIEVIRFRGLVAYDDAVRLQQERQQAVAEGHAPEALFLLEHRPVVTLGRQARSEHVLLGSEELARQGIALRPTDRGGDVTYHGPGQMIAYPILDLGRRGLPIGQYLRDLEGVLIRLLGEYGLPAKRRPGYTGVWIGQAKVAAIGIAVRRHVTSHGVALNVNPDMEHFRYIVPCGISDRPVTTMEALLGRTPAMKNVMKTFEEEFLACFGKGRDAGSGANDAGLECSIRPR